MVFSANKFAPINVLPNHSWSYAISDTKIEDNSRGFKLQKANFDMEVNTAVSLDPTWNYCNQHCCWWGRSLAQSPHKNIPSESRGPAGLRAAGGQDPAENQAGGDPDTGETGLVHLKCGLVRLVHIFIMLPFKVVERRKQIEIEEQEIKRKEKELIATVKLELIKSVKLGRVYPQDWVGSQVRDRKG